MDSLQAVWLWGTATVALLTMGMIRSWFQLGRNTQKSSLSTWGAVLVMFAGLGYQCGQGISLVSSVSILLIPMAFALATTTQIINLKLKTPLLVLLSNPLTLLLFLAGLRLAEVEVPKERDDYLVAHIFLILLSFVTIFLSSLVSTVLLFQDLKLKRNLKFKITLPSLDFLERIVRTLNNVGLLILTFAIGAGAMYANKSGKDLGGSTFYWSLATWCLLATLSFLHFTHRINGQRFAWANFVVTIAALIALLGQDHG